MTAERFLLALRRMVARRGICSIIWSDNAKTFKSANKHLQQCCRVLEADKTQVALSEGKIQWKYIVERSPWWGGFYQRQLTTILAEIEAQLNSRPLTYLSADPGD